MYSCLPVRPGAWRISSHGREREGAALLALLALLLPLLALLVLLVLLVLRPLLARVILRELCF